jgi:hypothetical protein
VIAITEPKPVFRDYPDMMRQEAAMSVAQVISFDQRRAMGRSRRMLQNPTPCLILPFPCSRVALPAMMPCSDDDRAAGRGRDPG